MHAVIRVLFKCEHCGSCCRLSKAITGIDIDRVMKYTHEDEATVRQKLEEIPCGYQVDNLCTIHFAKPGVCKWWPGPGAKCPAYQKLVTKYCKPGSLSRICREPEFAALYTRCILNNDVEAATELLQRLEIEV